MNRIILLYYVWVLFYNRYTYLLGGSSYNMQSIKSFFSKKENIFIMLVFIFVILALILLTFFTFQSINHATRHLSTTQVATNSATDTTTTETTTVVETTAAPSNNLTDEELLALDNSDNEFWFNLSEPYSGKRNQALEQYVPSIEQYSGMYIGPDEKVMYITMDLGYEYNDNVRKILDITKELGVPINFFLTGEFLETEPQKVIRMSQEGHLIGNHTVYHPRSTEQLEVGFEEYEWEFKELERLYTELTGKKLANWIRPPYGNFSPRTLAMNQRMGYHTVFWSYAYLDWDTSNQLDPAIALDNIIGQFHNGEVFLLHTISNTNVEILDDVINAARQQGYTFKRLDNQPYVLDESTSHDLTTNTTTTDSTSAE